MIHIEHLGTKTLETKRLVLRKFTMDDAEAMFDNWASDPEVTEYLTWPAHGSLEVTKQVLGHWISQYENKDFYQWAIVPKSMDQPIGTISVVRHDDAIGMVHIGYCIGREWWRRGFSSEALERFIRFFFEGVGANRIEARHDTRNPGSGRVMLKCGMEYEGTSRQSDINNQGVCDSAFYGMVRSDYQVSDR